MIVLMTEMEKLCGEQTKRWKTTWDYYCLAKDTWIWGYKQARDDVAIEFIAAWQDNTGMAKTHEEVFEDILKRLRAVGTKRVTVDVGNHQIGQKISPLNQED